MVRKGGVGRHRAALVTALVGLAAAAPRAHADDQAPPTLREVVAARRGVELDEQALVALVRTAGDDAAAIVADVVEDDEPAAALLRPKLLRALPAALGARGDRLLADLAHEARPAPVRLDALLALAAAGGPEAASALLPHLGETDEAVRAATVVALEGVASRADDPARNGLVEGARALVERAARPGADFTDARRAVGALAALVAILGPSSASDLAAALSHPRAEVRGAALAALCRPELASPAERPAVTAALVGALEAAPPRRPGALDERGLALRAIPVWGTPATCILPVLEAMEADPTCEDAGLAALRRLVGRDAGDVAAWWRLWARGATAWQALDAHVAALDSTDHDAVLRALEALADVPDPRTFEAIERLVRRLEAQSAWARRRGDAQAVTACRTLGALRDRRGVPALLVVLGARGASAEARREAHLALVRVAGRAGPPLPDAWRDAVPDAPVTAVAPGEAWRAALAPLPVTPSRGAPTGEPRAAATARAAAAGPPSPWSDLPRAPLLLLPVVGALLTAYGLWLAWRRGRDQAPPSPAPPPRVALTDSLNDASTAAMVALRSLEDAAVPSLRRGTERRKFTPPPVFHDGGAPAPALDDALDDADGDEEPDGVVHVVLGQAPRWRSQPSSSSPPTPAPAPAPSGRPDDAVWREALDALDEIAPSVKRAWARVSAEDSWHERIVYEAGAGRGTLREAITALRAGTSQRIDALDVELEGGARVSLYRREADRPQDDPAQASTDAAPDDAAWRGLLAALAEMGESVAAVWARLEGREGPETLWAREAQGGDLAAATAALAEVRPRVVQAGVRLLDSPSDLVLFDAGSSGRDDAASAELEPGFAGTIEALRAMGGAVRALSARLSIDPPDAAPRVLFPAAECRDLDEALAALESLEPLVVDVRARLLGAESDLVLLDRAAAPAEDGAARGAGRASSPLGGNGWEELVRAIEELGPQLVHVVVRGSDGEELIVFADDEGGIPSLVTALRGLDELIVHVRVKLAGLETELVLLDTPVAPPRASTFRELVGGGGPSVPRCLAA